MTPLILVALITRSVLLVGFGLAFFVVAIIAWYEVVYHGRNGLTTAMRNLFFASTLFFFTTAPLTIFTMVDTVENNPTIFLSLVVASVLAQLYHSFTALIVGLKSLGDLIEQSDN